MLKTGIFSNPSTDSIITAQYVIPSIRYNRRTELFYIILYMCVEYNIILHVRSMYSQLI